MNAVGVLLLVPALLAYAQGPPDCSHFNVTVVADESVDLSWPESPSSGSILEYSTSIVDSEYIVTFTSYYTTEARDGFISAALRPFKNWTVLPRTNPLAEYPSDFSVLLLGGISGRGQALNALSQHPAVKQVTPQKMLTRILSSGEGNTKREPAIKKSS